MVGFVHKNTWAIRLVESSTDSSIHLSFRLLCLSHPPPSFCFSPVARFFYHFLFVSLCLHVSLMEENLHFIMSRRHLIEIFYIFFGLLALYHENSLKCAAQVLIKQTCMIRVHKRKMVILNPLNICIGAINMMRNCTRIHRRTFMDIVFHKIRTYSRCNLMLPYVYTVLVVASPMNSLFRLLPILPNSFNFCVDNFARAKWSLASVYESAR